jgi:hypothetical protein
MIERIKVWFVEQPIMTKVILAAVVAIIVFSIFQEASGG